MPIKLFFILSPIPSIISSIPNDYKSSCPAWTRTMVVRWQEYLEKDLSVKNCSEDEKTVLFADSLKNHPCRFTGRAAEKLEKHLITEKAQQISSLIGKSI